MWSEDFHARRQQCCKNFNLVCLIRRAVIFCGVVLRDPSCGGHIPLEVECENAGTIPRQSGQNYSGARSRIVVSARAALVFDFFIRSKKTFNLALRLRQGQECIKLNGLLVSLALCTILIGIWGVPYGHLTYLFKSHFITYII